MGVVEIGVNLPTTPLFPRDWAEVLRTFALVVRSTLFFFLMTLRFAILSGSWIVVSLSRYDWRDVVVGESVGC